MKKYWKLVLQKKSSELVNEYKYLGVVISTKLYFSKYVKRKPRQKYPD